MILQNIQQNMLIPVETKKYLLEHWSELSLIQKQKITEYIEIFDDMQKIALKRGIEQNPGFINQLESIIKNA